MYQYLTELNSTQLHWTHLGPSSYRLES